METELEVRLSSYEDCRDAYRHRSLRQALYDEGVALMEGVIVNLHGDAHRDRRRLENRLFRRDVFLRWEQGIIPVTIERVLTSAVGQRRGDLIPLARRAMMSIAAEIAGVDRPAGTEEEFEDLYSIMTRLSQASTVVHATGDKPALVEDGLVALEEFEQRFLRPSIERRRLLLESAETDPASVPQDVLTTLMRNQDALDLPPEVLLREVAYFPWVGSHSTSNALAHAMDHIFAWLRDHPEDRSGLEERPEMVQRFAAESLRLHPPSPQAHRRALADVSLQSGTRLPEGATVIIDVAYANRDVSIFGADADSFDPFRTLPEGVSLWGLAFGSGFHACLGQDLAGGIPAAASGSGDPALAGSIATMARILLGHGARPDPDDPPTADLVSSRPHFGRYPIIFD